MATAADRSSPRRLMTLNSRTGRDASRRQPPEFSDTFPSPEPRRTGTAGGDVRTKSGAQRIAPADLREWAVPRTARYVRAGESPAGFVRRGSWTIRMRSGEQLRGVMLTLTAVSNVRGHADAGVGMALGGGDPDGRRASPAGSPAILPGLDPCGPTGNSCRSSSAAPQGPPGPRRGRRPCRRRAATRRRAARSASATWRGRAG